MDLLTTILACSLYNNNSIPYAMVQTTSQNKPLMITVDNQTAKNFSTVSQAVKFANDQLQQRHEISIGLMQVSSRWLRPMHTNVMELLAPCKNMVVATRILNHALDQCAELQATNTNIDQQSCMLSIYKTGNPQAGLPYANVVISYANDHPFDKVLAAAKAKNPKEFTDMAKKKAKPTSAAAKSAVKVDDAQSS